MNTKELLPLEERQTQKSVAKGLVKKWEKVGLLEGLKSEQDVLGMATLLENQARQIVTEANRTATTANAEEWAGVALPLVRRIFSEIVAKDFVSVQPMNLPSGLVFFLDFKYATAQAGFLTGQGKNSENDSVFGVTNARRGTTAGTEGLYGAGRFGYTINDVSSSTLAETGSALGDVNATTFFSASANHLGDLNYNAEVSASYKDSTLAKITISTASVQNFDPEGVRAFTMTGTGVNEVLQEFTSYDYTNERITFIISGSGAIDDIVINYHKQPTDTTRGDFEEAKTQEEPLDIPELDLQLRSEPIVAKTRKLKAKWTPEFAQDLNAYHGIDAENELTSMLSEYISQEIDLEILDMLIGSAQTTEYWSAQIGYTWTGAGFADNATNGQAYNQGTWFQTLGTKMQKVSNEIHRLTLRGGANFVVVSPKVSTILESIPGYATAGTGEEKQYAMGVQRVGTLNNRYTVYKNPYMTENLILMGYRGARFLETGAVYAPYIPMIMTPLIYDPDNFTPRKAVLTRYAKKMLRDEFYGKVYIDGLDNF